MVRRAHRVEHRRTLAGALATAGFVGLPVLGVLSPPANAEEVAGAITSVDLVGERVDRYATTRLSLTWAVPDSADGGDTFQLGLPAELRAVDGSTFGLRNAAGDLVARAVVRDGIVTFTLTDYVDTHTDVHGSAWFEVSFSNSVEIGDELDLYFPTTGRVFRDDVTVTGVTGDYASAATKWQKFADPDGDGPLTEHDGLLWAVNAPRVTAQTAGGDITFTDTPGPGQAIVCDSLDLFWGTQNSGGVDQKGYYGPDRYTKDCTPESVTITMKTYDTDEGRIPYLLGRSRVTDPSRSEYRNSATVRVHRGGTYTVGDTVEADAGGVGEGRTPTPGSTSTSPEPTDGATTLVPGEPQPTTSAPSGSATTSPGTPDPDPSMASPTVTPTGGASPAPTDTSAPTATVTVPGPTATVLPGQPTTSGAASTPPVDGATPAPGSSTTTPSVAGGTPAPSATTTTPPVAGAAATPVPVRYVGGRPARSVDRIDTGVPAAAAADPWLVGGGLVLAGSSGLGLVLAGRRRTAKDDGSR